jgi:putative redox protein
MTIRVTRDASGLMKHTIQVRNHALTADVDATLGGEDAGPSPHDLYDSALGACKALTVLWYANRKKMPIENIEVVVERDDAEEANGIYRLKTLLSVTGDLSKEQRAQLLNVASKYPVHKLITQVTTEIETAWL